MRNGSLSLHGIASIATQDGTLEQFTWLDIVLTAADGSTFTVRAFPDEERQRLRVEQPEPQGAEA